MEFFPQGGLALVDLTEVSVVKIDPYLNEDAGTLSPEDHGEVFVLEDGTEVDLDFGHYERSLGSLMLKRVGGVFENKKLRDFWPAFL